ncbi:hypothetical protein SAMN04490179_4249 [Pseudomonas antarctica]|uniref:Uncharacterized protein n=1 Tax=Pseudomonas antarctica TaxID=219572 RepID=A0A1H0BDT7_9PSED|nr:hypothetical protein [Pseudomonas antarctica]KAF2406417.1 hypothetical protein PSAN_45920 [Pseudomonas antarctica]SDN43799.1 hypothetical protein SAMN04490179_4249 [Pseudomonas antarctica]
MAKSTEKPVTEEQAVSAPVRRTFRDLVYTSRTVVVPGTSRTYPVAKGQVEVPDTDNEALSFLAGSVEFSALEG